MRSITNFINEKMSEDQFNTWLEKNHGYEDLYTFFSDQFDPNWTKNKIDTYVDQLVKNLPTKIRQCAKDAGLDIEEVCWEAIHDQF